MSNFHFSQRSLNSLASVHPKLVAVAHRALELSEVDFVVTEGMRSIEQQRENVAKGASQTMKSYHLAQADGYAHAFDVAAWVGGTVSWDRPYYVKINEAVQQAAQELGVHITWGGTWRMDDTPHFQIENV